MGNNTARAYEPTLEALSSSTQEISSERKPILEDRELERIEKEYKKVLTSVGRKNKEIIKFRAEAERIKKLKADQMFALIDQIKVDFSIILQFLEQYKNNSSATAKETTELLVSFLCDIVEITRGQMDIEHPQWLIDLVNKIFPPTSDDSDSQFSDEAFSDDFSSDMEDFREEMEAASKKRIEYEQKLWRSDTQTHTAQETRRELRELYVKLARIYHPDTVQGDVERLEHEQVMKRITNAYSSGNLFALLEIEKEAKNSLRFQEYISRFSYHVDAIKEQSQKLSMLREHLSRLQEELRELKNSELGILVRQEISREKNNRMNHEEESFGMLNEAHSTIAEVVEQIKKSSRSDKGIRKFEQWVQNRFRPEPDSDIEAYEFAQALYELSEKLSRKHKR